MENKRSTDNTILAEAMALAEVVTDYAHFGEMAQALRAKQRALKAGGLELEGDVFSADAGTRLRHGLKINALAREMWIEARA